MIHLSGLVGFLLLLTAEGRVGNSSQLEFCSETEECLLFDLICKTDKYEVRHYDSVKMASTQETSYAMEFMMTKTFWRLYKYITGENEIGANIPMTSPVIMKTPKKSFFQRGTFTMSFLLPSEYQGNPPTPTNNEVYIDNAKGMNVYVMSYGGWLSTFSDNKKSSDLSDILDDVGAKYTKDFHYSVGYNSPMKVLNRHNEVWFEVEGDPVCSGSE